MKRLFSALLAALMLFSLSACAKEEDNDNGNSANAYDDSLLSELYSEEGEYTDENGNTLSYYYHVPRLESETAVAAALNAEIADEYGTIVQEQKTMMAARASLTCLRVSWESYWNGSLLCLVVTSVMDGDTISRSVYSYDFFGGKRLANEDLIARCGLSEDDFLRAVRLSAAEYFDETYRDALAEGSGADFAARFAERRARTLSDENINMELPCYLDGGTLRVIVPIGAFAGADSYDAVLTPNLSARQYVSAEAEDRFVHASLAGGEVRVWFEETEESSWYAENFRFDYETVYFVEGLYAAYTDVFIGSIGQGYFPYLFLLTEAGTVEYVNLLEGLTAGFLCCGGALGGVKDIVSFEAGEVEEEYGGCETVFAVDSAGEKHDLSGSVSDADWVLPSEFLGTWSASVTHDTAEESYVSDYVLTFSDGGGFTLSDIISGAGLYYAYSGQINYLGTNGEGMVFSYHLNESSGAVRYGAFTLLRADDELRVKIVAGESLFDAPVGRATVFEWDFS